MNYLKIYCRLIRHAQQNNSRLEDNIEKHHVFPLAIFGANDYLVKLTYRQHFIAHLLLVRICEKRYGKFHSYTRWMKMAVHRMFFSASNKVVNTSWRYDYARKCCSEAKKGIARCISEEAQQRIQLRKQYKQQGLPIPDELRPKRRLRGDRSQYKDRRKRMSMSELYEEAVNHVWKNDPDQCSFYANLSEEEFDQWIDNHNLMVNDRWGGQRPNPNVIKALLSRRVPYKRYYKETDFAKTWFNQRIHQVSYYGVTPYGL